MYNIGVRPTDEDELRGGNDAWGWPLSLAALPLKNLGGATVVPGTRLPTFDPSAQRQLRAALHDRRPVRAHARRTRTSIPGFTAVPLSRACPRTLAPG